MTPQENYLRLQNQCGIKPGDWVKVVCAAKEYEFGWCNSWDKPMLNCVGKTFQVAKIEDLGGVRLKTLKECDYDYCFPFFILEKVEAPVVKTVGQLYHEVFFLDKWETVSEVQKANCERVGTKLQQFIRATMEEKP